MSLRESCFVTERRTATSDGVAAERHEHGRAWRNDIRLSTAVLALLVATPLAAQERAAGFLDFQDAIPEVRVAVWESGGRVELKLLSVDSAFFGPFSLGGSEDLPPAKLQAFDSLVAALGAGQHLFIRGTADAYRWGGRYSDLESPRLNRSLAQERARWAQARAGTGEILRPRIDLEPGKRGFVAYVGTYEPTPMVSSLRVDTLVVIDSFPVPTPMSFFADLRLGAGLGGIALSTGGMDFAVPTVSFVFEKGDHWVLTASGGWRPAADGDNPPGDRAEAAVSVELTYFADWYAGPTLGLRGAWENLREFDAFVERAYGFFLGYRVRPGPVTVGVDLQVSNLSRFGETGSEWDAGVALSAMVHRLFR